MPAEPFHDAACHQAKCKRSTNPAAAAPEHLEEVLRKNEKSGSEPRIAAMKLELPRNSLFAILLRSAG